MKTILSVLNFAGAIVSSSINFYFLLSHDDLNKGTLEPIDLTSQMSDYLPIEFAVQILTCAISLVNQNYIFFMCQLPLAIYHAKMLATRGYKTYAITRDEYKNT